MKNLITLMLVLVGFCFCGGAEAANAKRKVIPAATATVLAATATVPANYGVKREGADDLIFFISIECVDAAKAKREPRIMVAPEFARKKMNLDKGFYTHRVTDPKEGVEQIFCFDIGGGKYIPHVLIKDRLINKTDVIPNGVGGYNFSIMQEE